MRRWWGGVRHLACRREWVGAGFKVMREPHPMGPGRRSYEGDALTIARRVMHDLRSPLGAIVTTAELLEELPGDELLEAGHRELVMPIKSSASQILVLLEKVAVLLRATYSEGKEWGDVRMELVVDAVLARAESRRVRVGAVIRKCEDWPCVKGVESWLVEIYQLLLNNALEHGGKAIEVGWDEKGDGVRFWVMDDGAGLSEVRAASVFPAFETLHVEASTNGLGLPVVRRLVELMGGKVGYEREGGGSRFWFWIPKAKIECEGGDGSGGARVSGDGGGELGSVGRAKSVLSGVGWGPELVHGLVEHSGDCIKILDREGRLVEINGPGQCLMEIDDVRSVLGEKWVNFWGVDYLHQAEKAVEQALVGGTGKFQGRRPTLKGKVKWWDVTVTGVKNSRGEVDQMLVISRDITREKHVQGELDGGERRFRTMANHMSQFAWMADSSGYIYWYNQRWMDYTGLSHEDMKGWGWQKVHHPDHRERVVDKFRKHIESGMEWEDTFPLRGVDGSFRWFLSRAIPLRDGAGKVEQWFGTNTDITDQLETEDALRKASQAKDDFIAVMSHELRTPLNPALLIASEAATRKELTEEVRKDFEVIRKSVEMEARLIDDLLDLTRISRGKLQLVMGTVFMDVLIAETFDAIRGDAAKKGLRLSGNWATRPVAVRGDDLRLRQVLTNLLRNAIKFTPSGGEVGLSAWVEGSKFRITVRDTGIGMTGEELARAFEPFAQGDHAGAKSEQRFGGLGLGLAISKMLVALHEGDIRATSEGVGRGTTVVVELPVVQGVVGDGAVVRSLPVGSDTEEPGEEERLSILLVEDHEATRAVLAMLLQRRGHMVVQAASVTEAYHHAVDQKFDLLMSDIGLPDGRGDELMVRLRELNPRLRGIALSGYGMESDLQRSRSAGFEMHLTKPVSLEELNRALHRLRVQVKLR